MSTKKEQNFPIVDKILAKLNLSDEGKFTKFYTKEVKRFTREVANLEANETNLISLYQQEVDALHEQREDAYDALEDAKSSVTLDDVKDNATMNAFSNRYWSKIDACQEAIEVIEDKLEKLKESHEEELKDIADQIAVRKERISYITTK